MQGPFGDGARQWARKTLAKVGLSSATLAAGELLVDEQGGVYGGSGALVKNTPRLARVNEVTPVVQTAIANSAAQVKSDLTNGAEVALDTLGELAVQLRADESGAAALTTTVGKKVDKPVNQTAGRYAAVGSDGASIVYIDPPATTTPFDGGVEF